MNKPTEEMIKFANDIASESPDPWKKVGCLGFDIQKQIVATGFNHAGGRAKPGSKFWINRDDRRNFVIHAELNMLAAVPPDEIIQGIVTTLFPCIHCMRALAAFGIIEVHYGEIYDKDRDALAVADFHGITCIQYKS